MNSTNIQIFLNEMGVGNSVVNELWVNSSCVLAPYTHERGVDLRPSFGISINNSGESFYHCFTCQIASRPLTNILHTIWRKTGSYPHGLSRTYSELEVYENNKSRIPEYVDRWKSTTNVDRCEIIPPIVVDEFMVVSPSIVWAHDFLLGRGISEKTYRLFDIRVTKNRDIVFPFTNVLGNVMVMVYRSTIQKKISIFKPEHLGIVGLKFPNKRDSGSWFGLHLIDFSKPLLILEGEIDAMRTYELGWHNVISSGGVGITKTQVSNLHSSNIIIGLDSDDAGKQGARRLYKMLAGSAVVSFADWSLVGCKDPGDIRKREDFIYVMKNLKKEI